MRITLPWPSKDLSPNARVHWSRKAKASQPAREMAFYTAKHAKLVAPETDRIHLWIDFYPPTRRWPDTDNMLSRCKPYLDGLADALGVNDQRFVPHPYVRWETVKGGEVRILITADPA